MITSDGIYDLSEKLNELNEKQKTKLNKDYVEDLMYACFHILTDDENEITKRDWRERYIARFLANFNKVKWEGDCIPTWVSLSAFTKTKGLQIKTEYKE